MHLIEVCIGFKYVFDSSMHFETIIAHNIDSVVEQYRYRFGRCEVPTDFRIWLLFASKQGRGERQEQRESLSQPTQSKYSERRDGSGTPSGVNLGEGGGGGGGAFLTG